MTGDQEERRQQKMVGLGTPFPCPISPSPFFMVKGKGSKKGLEGLQGQEWRREGLALESRSLEWCKLEGRGHGDEALAL